MDEKQKRPKTAVLAFMQGLQNASTSADNPDLIAEKKVISSRNASSLGNRSHELETQLYTLPSGKKCRFITKTIDSAKGVVWQGNARDQEKIDRGELELLKASIKAQGQLVPVLARPNKNSTEEFTHEIIYGSRRLKACQELKLGIKIIEADMADEDALFFMDAENASREDLSLYEKATIYNRWLEQGIFDSADELSKKLGLSKRWVNKLLTLLKIPKYIIEALPNLKDLTKSRAEKLFWAYSKNSDLDSYLQRAIETLKLEKESYTGEELFERIFFSIKLRSSSNSILGDVKEKEIVSEEGESILTLRTSKSGKIKIEINKHLSPKKITRLLDNIEKFAKKL